MNIKRIGIDLAKQVFQVHGVDGQEKAILRRKLPKSVSRKSVSRRADSRQQSATHSQDRKQSNKKNLTRKHPSVGQFIAPLVVDCRYRAESTLQIDTP